MSSAGVQRAQYCWREQSDKQRWPVGPRPTGSSNSLQTLARCNKTKRSSGGKGSERRNQGNGRPAVAAAGWFLGAGGHECGGLRGPARRWTAWSGRCWSSPTTRCLSDGAVEAGGHGSCCCSWSVARFPRCEGVDRAVHCAHQLGKTQEKSARVPCAGARRLRWRCVTFLTLQSADKSMCRWGPNKLAVPFPHHTWCQQLLQ